MKRFLIGAGVLLGIAGVTYLVTVGCCHLMARGGFSSVGWTAGLNLTPDQRRAVEAADKQFLARKEESCRILCAKRAQMIQILKQVEPDRAVLVQLAEEIGQEQTALEKATLDHLLAVGGQLDPKQRERLMALISNELRTACQQTACGMTPGCKVHGQKEGR